MTPFILSKWPVAPLAITLLLASTAMFPQNVRAAERTYLMGSFDDIIIIGDMQVNLITNKAPSARAIGDPKLLDALRIERTGMTLKIRMQQVSNNDKNTLSKGPFVINIANRHIRNIALRGNAVVKVSQVAEQGQAQIGIDGGGEIEVGKLTSDTLNVDLSGAGKIAILGGKTRSTRVVIQGSGTYQASALSTRTLRLTHEGNANSSASVEDKADIINTGAGSIQIGGKGLCFISKAGAASITCSHQGQNTAKDKAK
jgi:Putative auto-transporter adhesin, head GIN domain